MVGNFSDVESPAQKAKINPVARWYKPWFYKHVEGFLQKVRCSKYVRPECCPSCT